MTQRSERDGPSLTALYRSCHMSYEFVHITKIILSLFLFPKPPLLHPGRESDSFNQLKQCPIHSVLPILSPDLLSARCMYGWRRHPHTLQMNELLDMWYWEAIDTEIRALKYVCFPSLIISDKNAAYQPNPLTTH